MKETREIVRYLLLEMDDAERDSFEERMFGDDELFFEVAAAENELVDRYVRGQLDPGEAARFEATFAEMPGRRGKVSTATAIRNYIEDERAVEVVAAAPAKQGFWQRIADSLRMPAFGLAAGSLAVVLLVATMILVLDRSRQGTELSQALGEKQRIEEELERLRKERGNASGADTLREQFDREHEAVGDLARETEQKERRIEQLERKLAEKEKIPQAAEPPPRVAVIVPTERQDTPTTLSARGPKLIVVTVALPASVGEAERLNVELNGRRLATGLQVQSAESGKSVTVTVPMSDLADGANKLTVFDSAGRQVAERSFTREAK